MLLTTFNYFTFHFYLVILTSIILIRLSFHKKIDNLIHLRPVHIEKPWKNETKIIGVPV